MSQIDYIHMQNIIVRNIEVAASSDGKEYGNMIEFLETMYVNCVVSLGTTMMQTAMSLPDSEREKLIADARTLLDAPPTQVFQRINTMYQTVASQLGIPDAYNEVEKN